MRSLLFSGHMIDRSDRPTPRFPPSKEAAARAAIRASVLAVTGKAEVSGFQGIAAAACGGDILFHEVCRELGVPSVVYLAIPVDDFEETSVAFAGPEWVERYRALVRELPVQVKFPDATAAAGSEVWEKANEWMLEVASGEGFQAFALIVLWDGEGGDGPGGTQHMLDAAKRNDGAVEIIDVLTL